MLYHRYGRHGAEAWIRRHKRRKHSSRAIVPLEQTRKFVRIRLQFGRTERIIIVHLERYEDNQEGEGIFVDGIIEQTTGEMVNPLQIGDPLADLRNYGEAEGMEHAHLDLGNDEIPSEEDLWSRAQLEGSKCVTRGMRNRERWTKGRQPMEMRDEFARSYLIGYKRVLEEKDKGDRLVNELTKRVKSKAQSDKIRDLARNCVLTSYRLVYHSAITVQEIMQLDTGDLSYLDQIEKSARIYSDVYQDTREEVKGNRSFSSPFSGR